MSIIATNRFQNFFSNINEQYSLWRKTLFQRQRAKKRLNSTHEANEKRKRNNFQGARFYNDTGAVSMTVAGGHQDTPPPLTRIVQGMVISYGGASFIADKTHVSSEFNNIINNKLSYERDALTRIVQGTFQGPLPEEQHNIRHSFNGHLPEIERQKTASLRDFVECNGECHLTNDGLKDLGNIYKDAAAENGSEPIFVFRQTLPTTSVNRNNRGLVNEDQPAPIYAHA